MEQAKIGALRVLVETYYDVQDQRMRASRRIAQYTESSDANQAELSEWHDEVDKRMDKSEAFLKNKVSRILKTHSLWTSWLVDVKGIGPCLAGGIIAWLNPHKAAHASSFWKYAGLAVVNGEAERRKRGERIAYNPKLKTMCWKIGESFVKTGGVYRKQYERVREQVNAKPCNKVHKDEKGNVISCFDAHKYAKAKRMVTKLFLAHVWHVWRRLEGLPVDRPWIVVHGGHSENDIVPPLRDKGIWTINLGYDGDSQSPVESQQEEASPSH